MNDDAADGDPLLQFPCSFPIKVMGRDKPGFREIVVGIVAKHVNQLEPTAVRLSPSRKGNFISVTVTVDAEDQAQLDAIYRELTAHEDVLVSL